MGVPKWQKVRESTIFWKIFENYRNFLKIIKQEKQNCRLFWDVTHSSRSGHPQLTVREEKYLFSVIEVYRAHLLLVRLLNIFYFFR
jgi:hypothetical protein